MAQNRKGQSEAKANIKIRGRPVRASECMKATNILGGSLDGKPVGVKLYTASAVTTTIGVAGQAVGTRNVKNVEIKMTTTKATALWVFVAP